MACDKSRCMRSRLGGGEAVSRERQKLAGSGYRRPSAVSSAAGNGRFQTRRSEPRGPAADPKRKVGVTDLPPISSRSI